MSLVKHLVALALNCPLSGDLTSFACVCGCVHGQWRKCYGTNTIFKYIVLILAWKQELGLFNLAVHVA